MFSDTTLNLHYNLDERFPSEIQTVITQEDKTFPHLAKCKVGFGEKEQSFLREEELASVIARLIHHE